MIPDSRGSLKTEISKAVDILEDFLGISSWIPFSRTVDPDASPAMSGSGLVVLCSSETAEGKHEHWDHIWYISIFWTFLWWKVNVMWGLPLTTICLCAGDGPISGWGKIGITHLERAACFIQRAWSDLRSAIFRLTIDLGGGTFLNKNKFRGASSSWRIFWKQTLLWWNHENIPQKNFSKNLFFKPQRGNQKHVMEEIESLKWLYFTTRISFGWKKHAIWSAKDNH